MMPARSTGQFSAESSLVFRQPQSYSSDEYSYSCEDTAFYYLHLSSFKKAPRIPVEAAAAQLPCEAGPAPPPFLPGRMPARPGHAAAAQGRAQGVNLTPGSATGELRVHIPVCRQRLPSGAGPSRAGRTEGCGKWPQKPGRGWQTRFAGAGALPMEQHTGLKPRRSRRRPLPLSPPAPRSPRGGGGARAAAAGGGT